MDIVYRTRLLLLIVLLDITVSVSGIQQVKVSCDKQDICALKSSSVTLICSYSNINVSTSFWFNQKDKAKWWKQDDPEDLALDSDYAGRVGYTETITRATLRITDLRERDSGEYHLVLITDKGEKYLSSAGVTLTVTDLQVTQDPTKQTLSCHTSCLLTTDRHRYFWYKNGQFLGEHTDNMDGFPVRDTGDVVYTCTVHGQNEIISLPLCVGTNCWTVTYPEPRVCVLEGSSVEFAASFSYPSNQFITDRFWHCSKGMNDLRNDFGNRVEYVNKDRESILKMKQLTQRDSGEYRFRLFGHSSTGLSGKPGVVLYVTDLQVRVSYPVVAAEGQTPVMLSCLTSCTLSNPTYMWYKNGQLVTNKLTKHNKLYLTSSEDSGNYSCSVKGREERRSTGQPVTIVNKYVTETSVSPNTLLIALIAFVPVLLLSLLAVVLCIKRKRGAETHIQSAPVPGDGTYVTLNPLTMSSVYDTLQNTQGSASDTYTTLNPATMSSDYDTLRDVADRDKVEKWSRTAES